MGVISLAGTVGELWSVKGGNKSVPIKLLEKSEAIVLKDLQNPDLKNIIIYEEFLAVLIN